MQDNAVSIRVTQRKERLKIAGVPIPFLTYLVSNGNYLLPDKTGHGCEARFGPLECLSNLIVNAELNRDGKQLGPIHATFVLIEDEGLDREAMEKMLEMYARSEQTTVTFEYR